MGSADRILTTHVGSLPRPEGLADMLREKHSGRPINSHAFEQAVERAVQSAVTHQVDAGIDIFSDGEMSKVSYAYYAQDRLRGMGPAADAEGSGVPLRRFQQIETVDLDFPDFAAFVAQTGRGPTSAAPPVCTGPLEYGGHEQVTRDIGNLRAAAKAANSTACFMSAASPGVIAMFASRTSHYASEDDYVFALAEAMKSEYEAIHAAGIILQIDCPDLALAPHMNYGETGGDPHRVIARNVEALNQATSAIPGEAVRIHLCWGNYNGPHVRDLAVADLFPHLCRLNARALSFEAANPRHEHEWEDWRDAKLPGDMVLIPGVIDSTTNFVEHPRLVAQRIQNFTNAVGRDRVIAGVDCGFGTFATARPTVFPSIVWAKLNALSEGAAIASEKSRP